MSPRLALRRFAAALSALVAAAAGPAPAQAPLRADGQLPEALRVDTFRLWPGRAPRAGSDAAAETPRLTVFRPFGSKANGTAVVIAPGGAYLGLASTLEGAEPAAWFTSRGVTAFVLTYRVGATARLPTPLLDGARAIRFVRAHAAELKVDPGRIGMMGYSAGGHLAATTAVAATPGDPAAADPVERVSSRPDFLILGYPWLEAAVRDAKGESAYCIAARRLPGPPCSPADFTAYTPTTQVTEAAPPTFIWHTTTDELVPVLTSTRFYAALVSKGVPAELHVFETGKHGTGLGGADPTLSRWPDLMQDFLRRRGLLTPAP